MKTAFVAFLVMVSFTGGMLLDNWMQPSSQPPAVEAAATPVKNPPAARPSCGPDLRSTFILSAINSARRDLENAEEQPEPELTLEQARATFAEALRTTKFSKRFELLNKVAASGPADSIPEIMGWAGQIPGFQDRDSFSQTLLGRWAEQDVQPALTYAQGLKPQAQRDSAVQAVVAAWQEQDPDAATEWILGRQETEEGAGDLLDTAIASLIESDPAKAWAVAARIKPGTEDDNPRSMLIPGVFSSWAGEDPRAAALEANKITNDEDRAMAFDAVASGWAGQDPEAALAWIRTLPPGDQQDQAWSSALIAQAEQDPEGALKRALQDPERAKNQNVISAVASSWAYEDPKAALAWADRLPGGELRDDALGTIGGAMVFDEPQEVLRIAGSMSSDELREDLVRNALRRWADTDPEAAAAEVERLPGGELKQSAIEMLVDGWSVRDPKAAQAYVETLPSGEEKDRALARILVGMAYQEPKAAAAYLDRFQGNVSPEVVEELVSGWANQSVEEVTAWVVNLAPGTMRDNALARLAMYTYDEDPDAAIKQLDQVSNESLRAERQRQLAIRALVTGEENWAETGTLPARFAQLFPGLSGGAGCSCSCPNNAEAFPEAGTFPDQGVEESDASGEVAPEGVSWVPEVPEDYNP